MPKPITGVVDAGDRYPALPKSPFDLGNRVSESNTSLNDSLLILELELIA